MNPDRGAQREPDEKPEPDQPRAPVDERGRRGGQPQEPVERAVNPPPEKRG